MATQYDNYGGFLVPGSNGTGSSGMGTGGGGGGSYPAETASPISPQPDKVSVAAPATPAPAPTPAPKIVPTPSVITTDSTRQNLQAGLGQMEADLKKLQAAYIADKNKAAPALTTGGGNGAPKEDRVPLTDAEARQLFGTDFTGLRQEPDGSYTMLRQDYNSRMGIITAPGMISPVPLLKPAEDPEYRELQNNLTKLGTDFDSANNALIESIKAMTASAVASQETTNRAFEGGTFTSGIVSGRARYAPEIQGAIQMSAVSAGIAKVNDLKMKGNQLIAEAMQAKAENQLKVLSEKIGLYQENKKEMRTELIETQKLAIEMDRNAREKAKAAREEMTYALESAAPSVAESLRGVTDENEKAQYIKDYAKMIGVDPNLLNNQLVKYQNEQDKNVRETISKLAQDWPDAGITTNDLMNSDYGTVMDKIMNSKSYQLGNDLQRAKINEALANSAKAWKAANGGGSDELLAGLEYWAEQMATTGALPAGAPAEIKANVGLVQALAKNVVLPLGTVIDATTGFKKKLLAKTEDAFSAGNAILGQLPELRDSLDQIYTYPGASPIKGALGLVGLKSVAQERFDTIVSNLTSQLALARSGQAVSEAEYQRLLGLLPKTGSYKGYNKERLYQFENGLRAELTSRLNANGARINGVDTRPDTDVRKEDGQYVQPGQMLVRDLQTGEVGIISNDEYDEDIYRNLMEK